MLTRSATASSLYPSTPTPPQRASKTPSSSNSLQRTSSLKNISAPANSSSSNQAPKSVRWNDAGNPSTPAALSSNGAQQMRALAGPSSSSSAYTSPNPFAPNSALLTPTRNFSTPASHQSQLQVQSSTPSFLAQRSPPALSSAPAPASSAPAQVQQAPQQVRPAPAMGSPTLYRPALARRARWNGGGLVLFWLLRNVGPTREVYWAAQDALTFAIGSEETTDAVVWWLEWVCAIVLLGNFIEAIVRYRSASTAGTAISSASSRPVVGLPAPGTPGTAGRLVGLPAMAMRGSPKTRPSPASAPSPSFRPPFPSSTPTPSPTRRGRPTSTSASSPFAASTSSSPDRNSPYPHQQSPLRASIAAAAASRDRSRRSSGGAGGRDYASVSGTGSADASPSPSPLARRTASSSASPGVGIGASPLGAYRARHASNAAIDWETADADASTDSFEVERALRALSAETAVAA